LEPATTERPMLAFAYRAFELGLVTLIFTAFT
jgi:hypothetical protein